MPEHARGTPSPATREVLVEERGAGFAQSITAGSHVLLADEPASAGGTDQGPDPYALLLAALGACTSMTLRMYARHKGWPVEHIAVRLSHAKIHAKDCATCESSNSRVDRIERVLEARGPLSAEQRARLLEIAERCPVHRTLIGEKEIATRWNEDLEP
jgi:putative redox protein